MRAGRHDGRKRLYLDFDGYFAAVEEQAAPALHGRPVAVLPYEGARQGEGRRGAWRGLIGSKRPAFPAGRGAGTGPCSGAVPEAAVEVRAGGRPVGGDVGAQGAQP